MYQEGTKNISSYAFDNANKLKELTLPSSLVGIGQDAFIGCINLIRLNVMAFTAPVCSNDCFEAVSKTNCELMVPIGCYTRYWIAPIWSEFNRISESDFSGIDEILLDDVKVILEGRNIVINGLPSGVAVRIFRADGSLVQEITSEGCDIQYKLSRSGMYFVHFAESTYKIVLK